MGKVIDLDDIPDEAFWCRDALVEALMDAPTIEPQPEIIHCRECKHRDKDGECGQYDDGTVAVSCKVPDDHYCGYAERRTDAD